ncbi:MAG: MMPL family transporter [Candidatus Poseidoniales archaeon]|nr:MAG: MMPL family transporter [Candidatus Poseidoniales archaeon]
MEGATDPATLENRLYFKMGIFVYDNAKVVLMCSLLLCAGLGYMITLEPRYIEGYGEGDLESVDGWEAAGEGFSDPNETAFESFHVLFHHPGYVYDDEEVVSAIQSTIEVLSTNENIDVEVPWETNEANQSMLVSSIDSSWSRVYVKVNMNREDSKVLLKDIYQDIELPSSAPEGMEKYLTDNLAIDITFDLVLKEELLRAELISAPLTILILLFVFGTVVSASLPALSGIYTVIAAVGIIHGLTYVVDDLTVYAVNIVSLLGIGLSVDYSLFIVNRFREELGRGHDDRTAIAMTSATAGRAILFSGLTVVAGLTGMLFFDNTGLPSLGWGGICATLVALTSSVILLPSILAILGDKINFGRVPLGLNTEVSDDGFWSDLARRVMDKPFSVLIPSVLILLAAGAPFLQAEWGITSWKALSPDNEARSGMEFTDENWPQEVSNTALIVYEIQPETDIFSEENIRSLYAFSKDILSIEGANYVFTYAHFNSSWSEDEVVDFWNDSTDGDLSPDEAIVRGMERGFYADSSVGDGVVLVQVAIEGDQSSESSRKVVQEIRNLNGKESQFGGVSEVNVAGFAAYNQDVLDAVKENLPIALMFILFSSYLLIFLQVRSVILPMKALIMNILSVSASFGILVWVFQEGNGAELLNFTPQPIDPTTPVMIFAILFGLSMDYEVLMLSRIHEEWERTGDNTMAVATGLQKSGRIITSAALVMVTVFSAFGFSSVSLMMQFGFMLALGVAVDATIVRALVVPSTMRLMGNLNWWSPKWLRRSLDRFENKLDYPKE